MRMTLRPFALPLRHVFTISRGSTALYRGILVELEQDGVVGYGEAGESDYYGATIENMIAALESVRHLVERWHLEAAEPLKEDEAAHSGPQQAPLRGADDADKDQAEHPGAPGAGVSQAPLHPGGRDPLPLAATGSPESLWQSLAANLASNRFALCALDTAAHDLWGKLSGSPVWRLWGLMPTQALPPTDYTIGLDAPEVMVAKLREFPDWPVYKIKLGCDRDLEIVAALRKHTTAVFRVDANCAWTYEETLEKAPRLRDLGVELIEQPLAPDRWGQMRELYRRSPLPLIADESCQTEADVERCLESFHGINVKLVKCGGLTPARGMLLRAKQLGLRTMVGCMTETTVGISAAAQLLPLVDYADLDGALLLAEDIATGVTIDRGRVILPSVAGCGVRL